MERPAALLLLVCACGGSGGTGAVNAPCTRTSDCQAGLSCSVSGVCAPPDAGKPVDGSGDNLDAGPHDASASS